MMKTARNLFALVALLFALSGCLSVKTQHKIEPINITVDINVKTEKALDDIFGDLYSETPEAEEAAGSTQE